MGHHRAFCHVRSSLSLCWSVLWYWGDSVEADGGSSDRSPLASSTLYTENPQPHSELFCALTMPSLLAYPGTAMWRLPWYSMPVWIGSLLCGGRRSWGLRRKKDGAIFRRGEAELCVMLSKVTASEDITGCADLFNKRPPIRISHLLTWLVNTGNWLVVEGSTQGLSTTLGVQCLASSTEKKKIWGY